MPARRFRAGGNPEPVDTQVVFQRFDESFTVCHRPQTMRRAAATLRMGSTDHVN